MRISPVRSAASFAMIEQNAAQIKTARRFGGRSHKLSHFAA
jgi:hypothetical protein